MCGFISDSSATPCPHAGAQSLSCQERMRTARPCQAEDTRCTPSSHGWAQQKLNNPPKFYTLCSKEKNNKFLKIKVPISLDLSSYLVVSVPSITKACGTSGQCSQMSNTSLNRNGSFQAGVRIPPPKSWDIKPVTPLQPGTHAHFLFNLTC